MVSTMKILHFLLVQKVRKKDLRKGYVMKYLFHFQKRKMSVISTQATSFLHF